MNKRPAPTILCLASYFKGGTFLSACRQRGCHVILLTKENLSDEEWPWQDVDERYFMPDLSRRMDVIYAVSYLARERKIDRIIALDDFDVETAAALREHLRIPGMGDTTARYFRDKLAMRMQAEEHGILVPHFSPIVNYPELKEFIGAVSPPWVLKPRSQAGAMGIKLVESEEQLWRHLEELGDRASFHLLEQFIPGDIFHVDAIVSEKIIVFAEVHKYKQPPMMVSHGGGIFMSRTVPRGTDEATGPLKMYSKMVDEFGMVRGVNHTEFILSSQDNQLYFLETAARVGGANIAELVHFATGINLWKEWADIEINHFYGEGYAVPEHKNDYTGIMICLARQEFPNLSGYDDPEVVWRLKKKHHAGLIVASSSQAKIEGLLDSYSQRFEDDFLAYAPPLDEAPN